MTATRQYAHKTTVTAQQTKAEIESVLFKFGATSFQYGIMDHRAGIQFDLRHRRYRIVIPLPEEHQCRSKSAYDQAIRSRWRSLFLVIKAKLVAVEEGIASLEEEFLAYLVLPSNQTAGDWLLPQIAESYARQEMPPLLPAPHVS